jgi:hypothetical protein
MPPILGSKIKKSLFMFTSNDFAFEKTLVLMFTSMFFAFDEGNLCFMLASVYFFALVCRFLHFKIITNRAIVGTQDVDQHHGIENAIARIVIWESRVL